jgi:Tol biopolymer transport system component
VDNQYIRWTRSDAIQFDPAPTSGSAVLYAQYRSSASGASDIYRADAPLGSPLQLTTGFTFARSPTPRADQVDFAFMAKARQSDSQAVYLLPFGGGDTASARFVTGLNIMQTFLDTPRFARTGTRLAYVSDSTVQGTPHVWWRDAANFDTAPVMTASIEEGSTTHFTTYLRPSWGADINSDGNPDSLVALTTDFFGVLAGLVKLATPDSGRVFSDSPWIGSPGIDDPDWSPDGAHVIFSKKNAGTNENDIWIISAHAADIASAVRVTSGPANDTDPRFNSDGTRIFFISNRVDKYGVNGIFGTERRGANVWSVGQFDRP